MDQPETNRTWWKRHVRVRGLLNRIPNMKFSSHKIKIPRKYMYMYKKCKYIFQDKWDWKVFWWWMCVRHKCDWWQTNIFHNLIWSWIWMIYWSVTKNGNICKICKLIAELSPPRSFTDKGILIGTYPTRKLKNIKKKSKRHFDSTFKWDAWKPILTAISDWRP